MLGDGNFNRPWWDNQQDKDKDIAEAAKRAAETRAVYTQQLLKLFAAQMAPRLKRPAPEPLVTPAEAADLARWFAVESPQ